MTKLSIDIEAVNTGVLGIQQSLDELVAWQSKLVDSFGSGWESDNASKVNEKLASVKASIDTIKASVDSIKNAVAQYKENVVTVDSSINVTGGSTSS